MKTFVLLAASLALSGCGLLSDQVSERDVGVRNVTFPAAIGANDTLAVTVEGVLDGGCVSFDRIEATRTAGRLSLRAVAREVVPASGACTQILGYHNKTYTDPATPARTSPFEIVVNGKSYGFVTISN